MGPNGEEEYWARENESVFVTFLTVPNVRYYK